MQLKDLQVARARLRHTSAPLADVPAAVRRACAPLAARVRPGSRVALAVGSRGITGIDTIVRAVVDTIRGAGGEPFIVPAMGSHGGATAEGQAQLLRDYGIDEARMGAPVRSSMAVVSLGSTGGEPDVPVWLDALASEADGIVAINRVKAHTDFHGPHESGVVKMLTIGLGKHAQAIAVHRHGAKGLREQVPRVARRVVESGHVWGALAIVEDGYDQTSDVGYAQGMDIFALDQAYLARSRQMMARLPFAALDVLAVDMMGKNFSGTGMDTNVIGRLCIRGEADGQPDCRRIAVLDVSPESHGNALGVGLADVTTARLRDKIDWAATNENVVTSGFLERGFLPLVMPTDREAIALALQSSGLHTPQSVRFARIRNTLHLDEAYLSPALLAALAAGGHGEQVGGLAPLAFGDDGAIAPF